MALFVLAAAGLTLGGFAAVRCLAPHVTLREAIGVGFITGVGAAMWALQIAFAAGVPPGSGSWLAAGGIGAVVFAVVERRALLSAGAWHNLRARVRSHRGWVGDAALAAALASITAFALSWPVVLWDSQSIWVAKGQGLLVERSLDGVRAGLFPGYPLGLPSMHAAALELGGEAASKLVAPLYVAALAGVVSGAVGRAGAPWVGVITALAVIATPTLMSFASTAYADVPFAAVATTGTVYLLEFVAAGAAASLRLAALATAATALLRLEAPLLLVAAIPVALAFARGRARITAPLLVIGAFAVAWTPWQLVFTAALNLQEPYSARATALPLDIIAGTVDFDRLRVIGSHFGAKVLNYGSWGLAFPLLAIGVGGLALTRRRLGLALASFALINVALTFVVFYSGPFATESLQSGWLVTTFDRFTLRWALLGTVAVGFLLQTLVRASGTAAPPALDPAASHGPRPAPTLRSDRRPAVRARSAGRS